MPAFDDRGKRIAFKLNGAEPGLYVVDTTPYPPERITEGTLDTNPVWTDDGQLAFTRWDDAHKPTVMLVSPDGGDPRVAHAKQRITIDVNRVTGELLLMSVEYTRLYLWDPATGKERAISTAALGGGHLLRASVSADGQWALVQSGPWGETTWKLRVDGTAEPEVAYRAGDGTTMERPLMRADGHVIVVPEIWVGELYRASLTRRDESP
jgi:hypothetical protein